MSSTVFRLAAAGLILCIGRSLLAQDSGAFDRQQRQYEEQLRQQMDRQPTPEQLMGVDWGGWFNFAYATFDNSKDQREHFSRTDLYLWGRTVFDKTHEVYARGRFSFTAFNDGGNPFGSDDEIWEAEVDRLYYAFDLRKATLAKEKKSLPYNAFTTVGRQYVDMGTGLVLSLPMDAVVAGVEAGNVEVKGLVGRSLHDTRNFDESPAVKRDSDRDFYGVQASYKGLKDHTPFVYYLWQQDHTEEHPDDPFQEYDYDSRYLGLGSKGRLALRNLFYQTELAWERGRDYGYGGREHQDPICALAYDLGLNYLFDDVHKPEASFEYLFASGDPDRRFSPTDTLGGNKRHTTDNGFNAFGLRNTGLAFAAPISNLHMFRLGGSFRPLPESRCFRNMTLGVDQFFYLKADKWGAGPDVNSRQRNSFLGEETDVYCNWRIMSDVVWTIRYGVFVPGDAYDTDKCRNFLFTGVTFSF